MKMQPWYWLVFCALVVFTQQGCSEKSQPSLGPVPVASSAKTGPSNAGAPVTVTTVKAQRRDLPVTLKATGTVTSLNSVDVRPRVTSTVARVYFQEGQFIQRGQLLFALDARTEEANLTKAQAQLSKDSATLEDAKRQLERAKQLFAQNFISQGAVDTAQALVDGALATITADQATIAAARVALSLTRIHAPNAGRAGAVNVFAGSSVQANLTTLVTITQLHPIGVSFSVPQRNLTDLLAALKNDGDLVQASLADGGGQFTGRLQFVDNTVDSSSGSVKVKAVFDNQDNKLWPGAFVEVLQTVSTLKNAVVVPQAAIVQSARGDVVYVVQGSRALLRPVKVLYAEGANAAVEGVQEGESVVVDGKQNVRPNSAVQDKPLEAKPAKSEKSGRANAASSA